MVDQHAPSSTLIDSPIDQHVADIVKRSRTSFYWSMRLLPRERRQAMFAVYAFCREVDDIADSDGPVTEKHRALGAWRNAISNLYSGRPDRPITRALSKPVELYHLKQTDFEAIIDGMIMDANGPIIAPPFETLMTYCARVAGAVGALSLRIFGPHDPRNDKLAYIQGEAVQLTNILRDLYDDALIGRCYLPAEYLQDAGITSQDPMAILGHPHINTVLRRVADLANQKFEQAQQLIGERARTHLRPAMVILMVYRRLLDQMLRHGYGTGAVRPRIPKAVKLWTAVRYGLF